MVLFDFSTEINVRYALGERKIMSLTPENISILRPIMKVIWDIVAGCVIRESEEDKLDKSVIVKFVRKRQGFKSVMTNDEYTDKLSENRNKHNFVKFSDVKKNEEREEKKKKEEDRKNRIEKAHNTMCKYSKAYNETLLITDKEFNDMPTIETMLDSYLNYRRQGKDPNYSGYPYYMKYKLFLEKMRKELNEEPDLSYVLSKYHEIRKFELDPENEFKYLSKNMKDAGIILSYAEIVKLTEKKDKIINLLCEVNSRQEMIMDQQNFIIGSSEDIPVYDFITNVLSSTEAKNQIKQTIEFEKRQQNNENEKRQQNIENEKRQQTLTIIDPQMDDYNDSSDLSDGYD